MEKKERVGRHGRRESKERPQRDLNLTEFERIKTKTKQDPPIPYPTPAKDACIEQTL